MPFFISCEEVENFILAYLDNNLSPGTKFKFEFHLKFCKECRDYLVAYRRTIKLSRAALEAEELPPLPEDLVKAIMEARD